MTSCKKYFYGGQSFFKPKMGVFLLCKSCTNLKNGFFGNRQGAKKFQKNRKGISLNMADFVVEIVILRIGYLVDLVSSAKLQVTNRYSKKNLFFLFDFFHKKSISKIRILFIFDFIKKHILGDRKLG